MAGMYEDPGNTGGVNPNHSWMISLHTSVGIVSSRLSQNRSRNISTLWPACRPCAPPPACADGAGGGGWAWGNRGVRVICSRRRVTLSLHQLFPRESTSMLPVFNRPLGDRRPLENPSGEIHSVQVALELCRCHRPRQDDVSPRLRERRGDCQRVDRRVLCVSR